MQKMFESFGVGSLPWIIRAYLLVFTLLLVGLLMVTIVSQTTNETAVNVFADGLKITLGALIGSLTTAANKTWQPQAEGDNTEGKSG
jgi:hypothetical protein